MTRRHVCKTFLSRGGGRLGGGGGGGTMLGCHRGSDVGIVYQSICLGVGSAFSYEAQHKHVTNF